MTSPEISVQKKNSGFSCSRKFATARVLAAILGIFLIGIAGVMFDSGVTQNFGAEGNQGVIPLLSLAGSLFVLLSARLQLSKEKATKSGEVLKAFVLLYISCMFGSFVLAMPDGWTLIAGTNLFFQVSTWSVFLLLIFTNPDVPRIEGFTTIIWVLFAIVGYLLFKADIFYFNLNWLALVFFAGVSVFFTAKSNRFNSFIIFLIYILFGVITLILFRSRGVALMFFSFGLIWIFILNSRKVTRAIIMPMLIILSLSSGFIGIYFYGTSYFDIADQYSRVKFDKRLSISRFERWTRIGNECRENSKIILHGVGLGGYSVGKYRSTLTASHNAAIDTLFFLGIIGFFARVAIFFCLYLLFVNLSNRRKEAAANAIFASILMGSNYYGLTGFTHLGGTIPVVLVLGWMASWVKSS